MENKDLIFNSKRTTNKPIYQYKKISYYSKDSEDSNGEDEYSYILNAKKIKALKEKIYKNEKKMSKSLKFGPQKNEININYIENKIGNNSTTVEIPKISKKKKIVIKKKKIKKVSKNTSVQIPLILPDKAGEGLNSFRTIEKEEKTDILVQPYKAEDENKNISKENVEKESNLLSISHQVSNIPDFFGFEVDEEEGNENNRDDFIFDGKAKSKKEINLKKNISSKKIKKIVKHKKKEFDDKQNSQILFKKKNNSDLNDISINDIISDIKTRKEENNNIKRYNLNLEEIEKNKKPEELIHKEKESENENKNNNIEMKADNTKNNENKIQKKKIRKISHKKRINMKTNLIIRIQSIWRAHKTRKKIKFINLTQKLVNEVLNLIKNKKKQNICYFIGILKERTKEKKILKHKNKKSVKKIGTTKSGNESKRMKELMEKEKRYDLLVVKYEEVLKQMEKMKSEFESGGYTFFNPNLNLIDNQNQNISINIFPTNSNFKRHSEERIHKKNKSEIKVNKLKTINLYKLYNFTPENYEKTNEISNINNINIINHNKNKNKDFIINRKINVEILKVKKDESKGISKQNLFVNINNSKSAIINKIKSFSIINNKSNVKKSNFNEYNLIINKIISDNIFQTNKNFDKNFKNLVINKQISKFKFNQKKRKEFIITREINQNIMRNDKFRNKANVPFCNLNLQSLKNIEIRGEENKYFKKESLFISENNQLKFQNIYNKKPEYAIDKVINQIINLKDDIIAYEDRIINYLDKNRHLLEKIKKFFNLNKMTFNNNELVINKVRKIKINKMKKRDNIISKAINNNFIIWNNNKLRNNYIITRIENKLSIMNNRNSNKNNFIITKVTKNFNVKGIDYDDEDEDTVDVYISISKTYQLTLNSSQTKKIQPKVPKNLIINKVINDSIIDKIIIRNKNTENRFKENKLIINKIINNYNIQKSKKTEHIICKSNNNNFILYNNRYNIKNSSEYIITKVQNKFNIRSSKDLNKNLVINKTKCNYNIQGIISNKNNNENKYIINKIININLKQMEKKANIITKTINDNIISNDNLDNSKENNKGFNNRNSLFNSHNLVINKIISKFNIINKDNKGEKFKSKLFISENNQLFIKRYKYKKIINDCVNDNNEINNINLNLSNNSRKESNTSNSEVNNNNLNKKPKRARKFKSKFLFIEDNNQLRIKGIKNKK